MGNLGTGDTGNRITPVKISFFDDLPRIKDVAIGIYHTVFLNVNGEVYACGYGRNGQLGTGDRENRLIPTKIEFPNGGIIKRIGAGYYHTLFLSETGIV
jgi:alpha-tubulin suppressor-like RCC1 family protein